MKTEMRFGRRLDYRVSEQVGRFETIVTKIPPLCRVHQVIYIRIVIGKALVRLIFKRTLIVAFSHNGFLGA